MKTSVSHRITCILLSIFIFISSAGLSLDIHYCGNNVYDISVLGKSKSCQKDIGKTSHDKSFKKKGCCSFDHFKIETSDTYKFSEIEIEGITFQDFCSLLICSKPFVGDSVPNPETRIYPPPEIKNNKIYLKVESLLI